MEEKKVRIGIIGGTFDPIHIGHLIIAQNAISQYQLDRVLFIPTGQAPHKDNRYIVQSAHRLEMIRLSIKDNKDFFFSAMEINEPTTSYTYLTLQQLKHLYPEWDLYFIMGADSLDYFDQWYHPEIICAMASILVAVRDRFDATAVNSKIESIKAQFEADIRLIETPNISVSSRDIRNRVATHEPIRYLVTQAVEEYIERHNLYQ